MKNLKYFCLVSNLIFWVNLSFGLTSPFESTVENLKIPNSHWVDRKQDTGGAILRGMAPRNQTDYEQLKALGTHSVLIFKHETRKELSGPNGEFLKLENQGISYKHISFGWKDLDFEKSCRQMIEGLKYIKQEFESGRTVFFHCTVGEDRTGALGGLYRIFEQGWDLEKAFEQEMCERGYADGNPQKPAMVVGKIHESVTPFVFVMVKEFKDKELDPNRCSQLPKLTLAEQKMVSKMRCR